MSRSIIVAMASALLLIGACSDQEKTKGPSGEAMSPTGLTKEQQKTKAPSGKAVSATDLTKEQLVQHINRGLSSQGNRVEELTVTSKRPSGSGVEYTVEGKFAGAYSGTVKGTVTVTERGDEVEYRNDLKFEYP
jgi:hypothetical protein